MKTAREVMDAYSSLDDKEQAEFDRRYKDLMAFRRDIRKITKEFVAAKKRSA